MGAYSPIGTGFRVQHVFPCSDYLVTIFRQVQRHFCQLATFWEENQSTPRILLLSAIYLFYSRFQHWLSLISPPTQHIKAMQMVKIMLINVRMVRIKNAGHFKYTYSHAISNQWIAMVTLW